MAETGIRADLPGVVREFAGIHRLLAGINRLINGFTGRTGSERVFDDLGRVFEVLEHGRVVSRIERLMRRLVTIASRSSRAEETEIRRRGLLLIAIDKIMRTLGDISVTTRKLVGMTMSLPSVMIDMAFGRAAPFLTSYAEGIRMIVGFQMQAANFLGAILRFLGPAGQYLAVIVYVFGLLQTMYRQWTSICESVTIVKDMLLRLYVFFREPFMKLVARILSVLLGMETIQKSQFLRSLLGMGAGAVTGAGAGAAAGGAAGGIAGGVIGGAAGVATAVTAALTAAGKIAEAMGVSADTLERASRVLRQKGYVVSASITDFARAVWQAGDRAKKWLTENVPVIGWLLGGIVQGLVHGFAMIVEFKAMIYQYLQDMVAGLYNMVKPAWDTIVGFFTWLRDTVESVVRPVWEAVVGFFNWLNNMLRNISLPGQQFAAAVSPASIGANIVSIAETIAGAITEAFRNVSVVVNVHGQRKEETLGAGIIDIWGAP